MPASLNFYNLLTLKLFFLIDSTNTNHYYGWGKTHRELISSIDESFLVKRWPPELNYPDCSRLILDEEYAKVSGKSRVTLNDNYDIPTESCDDFHLRGHYSAKPLSIDEAEFPLAFAYTVYEDFALLERIFNVIYMPQNFYCYSIDNKASKTFKRRVRQLAKCFPNVVVPKIEFSVFSDGKNVTASHISCIEALNLFQWKYIFLLQNHDLPLRTNAEFVKILKIFNGTNDISTLNITPFNINPDVQQWNISSLNLFRNKTLNLRKSKDKLYLTKSSVGVSVSRKMAEFILFDLNVTNYVNQLENWSYGMDENFISTLNSNDVLEAPGGFTRACLKRGFQVSSITRVATWSKHPNDCKSGHFRHNVCIYGVEDLQRLSTLNHFFVNKFMPAFDYGAAVCWLETIYNRTHFPVDTKNYINRFEINEEYYLTLPHVQYNRNRQQLTSLRWTSDNRKKLKFNCVHPYQDYHF